MRCYRRTWMMMAMVCLVGLCLGCPGNGTTQPGGTDPKGDDVAPNGGLAGGGNGHVDVPPPFTIPKVVLDAAQDVACQVKQYEAMPDATLTDLAGKTCSLAELREGKKLTVVCFWQDGIRATQMLQDLQADCFAVYAEKGVQVVGVNVGDAEPAVRQQIDDMAVKFPTLLDPDGVLFAKVATADYSRVYLLDADGKILWFDIQFADDTRRILDESIKLVIKGS
ncbi:MAG: redoxin domain-containing protein [Candidatus Nealsonbacteria bacterium]|nr:redoxin domain-containing protein [Candidatus Nealsonbacteria bacterium]